MNQYRVKKICLVNGVFCKIDDVIEAEEYEVRPYINADFIEVIVMSSTSSDTIIIAEEENK